MAISILLVVISFLLLLPPATSRHLTNREFCLIHQSINQSKLNLDHFTRSDINTLLSLLPSKSRTKVLQIVRRKRELDSQFKSMVRSLMLERPTLKQFQKPVFKP